MFVVHDVLLDECPTALRGIEEVPLAGHLVSIEETDDCLGLRPPLLVGIDDSRGVGLIEQSAVGINRLIMDGLRHLDGDFAHSPQKRRITKNLRGLREQPASLDVVAKRNLLGARAPLLVEEEDEVVRGGMNDVAEKNLDQLAKTQADSRVFVDTQQRGVGLQQMEMSVHGLLFVHVYLA